jgi:hypothetical protein
MATTKKGTKLGPRVTVRLGQVKRTVAGKAKNVTVYSYMAKSTADYFGFKIEKSVTSTASGSGGKKRSPRLLRGSVGSGSIKIPAGKTKSGATKYKRIPVPSGLPLVQIQAFLSKASKNKPESFVSREGRTYPISTDK